ncbi:MAG: hypothetical protein H6970_13955 [Gammaproteobacteria bacterium]|nr:hypothetical protein [Gammaproteobacteria bacterium]
MSKPFTVPTKARYLNAEEWKIVQRVFGDTLPAYSRIIITNGAMGEDRAIVLSTSAITSVLGSAAATAILGVVGTLVGQAALYLTSFLNLGYLINVGPAAYRDLSNWVDQTRDDDAEGRLLVHEMTHVWQGKHSAFALTYLYDSLYHNCTEGRKAYKYQAGKHWSSYHAEQQAMIVQDWYISGEWESGDLWPYIRDHVRKGKA